MKLTDEVYLIAAGDVGIRYTSPSDCYVYLIDGGNNHLAMVDAGVGADNELIISKIKEHGYDPKNIETLFLTHAHTDHIGGAAFFREKFNCKVAISEEEAPFIENADEDVLGLTVAKASGYYAKDAKVEPCKVDIRIKDDQVFKIGNLSMRAIIMPGHSRAGVCYLLQGKTKRYIFVGDHISFGGLISLQNYENSGSSMETYRQSAHKLEGLKVDAFLPGHLLFTLERGQMEIDNFIRASRNLFFGGHFLFPSNIF